jgi:hypothetical protein
MAQSPPVEPPGVLEIPDPEGAEPERRRASVPERRETARLGVAIALVVIFGIEVIGAMLALWLCSARMAELKDILSLILSPTVALVGAVTGFYFGTQDAGGSNSSA